MRIGLGPGVPAGRGAAFRERTGVDLLEGYGSTETNFVIADRARFAARRRDGLAAPGLRRARGRRRTTSSCPPARPASWCCAPTSRSRSRAATSACRTRPSRPGATSGSTPATAWCARPTARFRFVDRIKDAIRRRGENISSYEVEQVLLSHPAVAAVAVYPGALGAGRRRGDGGARRARRPARSTRPSWPRSGRLLPVAAAELRDPALLDIVAELPRTENGKVQKFRLRERGVTPTAWDMAHPRAPHGAPPQGGATSGPAQPDPRWPLEGGGFMTRVARWRHEKLEATHEHRLHRRRPGRPLLRAADEAAGSAPRRSAWSSATAPTTRSAGASCSPTRRSATCEAADPETARADPRRVQPLGRHRRPLPRPQRSRSGGHGFCGIGRKRLLNILQERCEALGVELVFETDVTDDAGAARAVRRRPRHRQRRPQQPRSARATPTPSSPTSTCAAAASSGSARSRRFDAFTFAFEETEHGWFQAHAYQFDGDTSTFIVETPEDVWQRAGLERMSQEEAIAFCERLFARTSAATR